MLTWDNVRFIKGIDQLISATLLKINHIIDSSRDFPGFPRDSSRDFL